MSLLANLHCSAHHRALCWAQKGTTLLGWPETPSRRGLGIPAPACSPTTASATSQHTDTHRMEAGLPESMVTGQRRNLEMLYLKISAPHPRHSTILLLILKPGFVLCVLVFQIPLENTRVLSTLNYLSMSNRQMGQVSPHLCLCGSLQPPPSRPLLAHHLTQSALQSSRASSGGHPHPWPPHLGSTFPQHSRAKATRSRRQWTQAPVHVATDPGAHDAHRP